MRLHVASRFVEHEPSPFCEHASHLESGTLDSQARNFAGISKLKESQYIYKSKGVVPQWNDLSYAKARQSGFAATFKFEIAGERKMPREAAFRRAIWSGLDADAEFVRLLIARARV